MSITEIHAERTVTDHAHGADCGHEAVAHADYVHGTHHHALYDDHYDEHRSSRLRETSKVPAGRRFQGVVATPWTAS